MDEQMSENQSPEEKPPQEEPLPPSEQLLEGEGSIPGDQKTPEPQPMGRSKRYGLFAVGFLGWFLVNGLVWLLISRGEMNLEEQEGMVFINALAVAVGPGSFTGARGTGHAEDHAAPLGQREARPPGVDEKVGARTHPEPRSLFALR